MSIEALTLLLRALGCPFFPPPLSLWHIKQNAVFGIIRFLAAMAEKREEGGRGSNHRRSRSVPPFFGIIPPNRSVFPGRDAGGRQDDVSQEQLARQQQPIAASFCKENWW